MLPQTGRLQKHGLSGNVINSDRRRYIMKKLVCMLISIVLIMTMLCACGAAQSSSQTRVVTDLTDTEVVIPESVDSVIVLGNLVNQVLAICGTETITAISSRATLSDMMYVMYPGLESIKRVDDAVTVEEALELGADVVFVSSGQAAEAYRRDGIPAIVLSCDDTQLLVKSFLLIGEVVGGEARQRSEKMAAFVEDGFACAEELKASYDSRCPSVYYVKSSSGVDDLVLRTDGDGSFVINMISLSGASACSFGYTGLNVDITQEELLSADPEYILIGGTRPEEAYQTLTTDPTYAVLSAVSNDRVFIIPSFYWQWEKPGIEAYLGCQWMVRLFHPEALSAQDVRETVTDLYSGYFSYAITNEECDALCRDILK